MATNPFKSFIPYLMNAVGEPDLNMLGSMDPSGGQWRHVGFTEPLPGESFCVNLDGAATLMAVQFNERILPGKVRDEQLSKEVARLEQLEGRKLSKKEYAQLREQTEFDLLPRAFIRRTVVPVIIIARAGPPLVLICTSSQKRADDVVGLMRAAWDDLNPWQVQTLSPFGKSITTLARDGFLYDERIGQETFFYPTDCAVLKGPNKKTIRIKDKPLDEADAQALVKDTEYDVAELGIRYGEDDVAEPELTFVLNSGGTFKRVTLPDVKATAAKEDAFGFALLCAQTYKKMLRDWFSACGGFAERPAPSKSETPASTATTTIDEDDEL